MRCFFSCNKFDLVMRLPNSLATQFSDRNKQKENRGRQNINRQMNVPSCFCSNYIEANAFFHFYLQTFHGATGPCKETTPTKLRYISSSNCSSGSSTPSRSSAGRLALPGRRNEPCRVCNKPVFILERLNVTGKLLHRTCFKCARCKNQLSIASYYETEEGAYCCEMCPDEEVVQTEVAEANKKVVEDHMDSDEDSLPESMQATTNTTNNNENNASNNNATEVTTTTAVDKENNITELKAAEWNDEVKESENLKSEDVEAATAVTASEAEDVSKDAKQPSADDATENNDKELDNGVGDGEVESKSKDEESGQAAEVNVVDTEKDATSINSETKINIEHEEQPNETETVSSKEDNPDHADAKDATTPLPECDQFQEKSDEAVVQEQEDVNDKAVDEVNDEVTHGDDNQKEATQDAQADHDHDEAVAPLEHETSAAEDGKESATNMHSTMISDEPEEKEQEDKSADTNVSEAAAASALEESYPDDLNPFGDEDEGGEKKQEVPVEEDKSKNISTNPFGSDFEDSDGDDSNAAVRKKSAHGTPLDGPPKPPRTSLNPFGSDFEDDDENLSIQSGSPNTAVKRPHRKKKRHAPPPPTNKSPMPSPIPRPAPRTSIAAARAAPPPRPPPPNVSQLPKERKEADNINRRSQILEQQSEIEVESNQQQQQPPSIVLTPMSPDKAQLEGKWKKKKGPAPPRPIPPKRQVKKLPRKAVNTELHDIEVKQQELERQGVELEKSIREVCAKSDAERTEAGLDNNDRDSLGPEAEDLIMQLFELVNEKNDLFRRQTELMYMKREHRLEEEHADIEHQVFHF